ncbi:hypothetical protein NIES267_20580 [Calothrix parasitica NIES-267]|uniref:DUF2808 domain-containing protein n=1 Tax=Calothrix parasitica NIES-267 TaxID=1973488 RepID=A0A1Z4LMX4_9CYAN|nr:hypothetical protein NIES267_20580 [Calothrix parasitica NIES-267]
MKNKFIATLTTLLIANTYFVNSESVLANKVLINRQITTPIITRSVADDNDFRIELTAGTLPIKDLAIILPQQMTSLENIRIKNNSGQDIKAEIQKNKDQVLVTFSEPVEPGNTLKIRFTEIDTESIKGDTLLYQLSVQQEGLLQRIPIGTARIDVPDAS